MNWFTNLFQGQKHTPASPIPANRASSATSESNAPEATPPLVEAQQSLNFEQLKHFAPLSDLDKATLTTLNHSTALYPKDAVVFCRDQPCDYLYYLVEGQLSMQPDCDNQYQIQQDSTLAALPLNGGKHFGATAITACDSTILKVPLEINKLWSQRQHEHVSCVELVDIELPEEISNKGFFDSFAKAYRENKLRLPSLPNVAFKLQQAMQQDIGIGEAVEIIHIDPPIVAKLIQVANSPLYASAMPISNCHDAVNRIGLNATRNLVLGISLKQLFHSKDRDLMKGMQQLWKNSLYVSSLSFVLAQECSRINPEDALLAGLICDIGAIPLLHFAEQFPERYPNLSELQSSLQFLRGPVGSLVLHTLGFSEALSNIPHQAENWFYDSGDNLNLSDIVILAKLHSYFGTQKAQGLPYLNAIPAYAKLDNGKLDPDFSLSVLHRAQNRINAVMHLLS